MKFFIAMFVLGLATLTSSLYYQRQAEPRSLEHSNITDAQKAIARQTEEALQAISRTVQAANEVIARGIRENKSLEARISKNIKYPDVPISDGHKRTPTP